jgi:4-amino-4-deoxy-L-arabinose transferase-like glycosyltransferase
MNTQKPAQHIVPLCHIFIPVFVLLIAAFARLYMFNEAPPGLQHDEIFKAQEGRALVEQGDFRLFYPSNQGHEGMFVWVLGVSYLLFGTSFMMIKFPAFICGMLTVALTYRVVGEIVHRRAGFVAAGLTAVSFWMVSVNRMGLRANLLPLFALLIVWGVFKVYSSEFRDKKIVVLIGIALGLAIYTYTSSFALYVAFGVFLLALIVFRRSTFSQKWRLYLIIGVTGLLLALPMVYIRLNDPQGTNRVSTISRPLNDFLAGKSDELMGNFWGLVGMPFFTGDPEWRYNVSDRPLFVTPVGLLVYLGFGVALFRVRKSPVYIMFLVFATVGLLPSLLTVSAPSFLRSIIALPAVMLFVALAVDLLPDKRLVWAAGAGVIALTGATDWTAYFDTWIRNDEVQTIYRDDLEQLAKYPTANTRMIASTSNPELDPLLFQYYQPQTDVVFFNGQTNIVLSDQPALLFISPLSAITPPHLDWLGQAQGTTPLSPIYRQDGEVAFEVYQLDAAQALQSQLTEVQNQPVYLYNQTQFPRGDVSEWAEEIPYPVNFGTVVQLVGVELPRREINSEHDGVNIQLYFQPLIERIDVPLNVFVHMSRRDGNVHAQRDFLGVPTIEWTHDLTFIQDNFVIAGPTPPGRYIITMGIYNFQTGERLPILNTAGEVIGDRLVVDRLRVVTP